MRSQVVTYATLTVLLAVALAFAPSVTAGTAPRSEWVMFVVSLTAVSISLPVLAVKDSFAFATFLALAAVLCLAAMGFAITLTEMPTTGQYVRAGLAGTALIGAIVYLIATQVRRDPIPNVLRDRFERGHIAELHGVQLAAIGSPTGDLLEVYIQNCTDAPRTVELRFEDGEMFPRPSLPITFGALEPTILRGAETKVVRIPIAGVQATWGLVVDFALVPRVSGAGGRRVRSWRARGLTEPMPLWVIALTMLVALPLGFYVFTSSRGGFRLALPVAGASGRMLPPSTVTTLWSPEQAPESGFGRAR